MQYRKFGKLDENASALGFGCMRLPTLGAHTNINYGTPAYTVDVLNYDRYVKGNGG